MIEVLSRMRLPITPQLPDEVARLGDIITGESVNYSLEPKNTQVRWVDGQFVWRRVFILMTGAAVNTNNIILHIPNGWDFHGLVRLDGYVSTTADERVPLTYYASASDYISIKIAGNSDIIERHGAATMNSRPMIVIVDYISAPTGGSSWDGATTLWDSGQSSWDALTRGAEPLWDDGVTAWDRR